MPDHTVMQRLTRILARKFVSVHHCSARFRKMRHHHSTTARSVIPESEFYERKCKVKVHLDPTQDLESLVSGQSCRRNRRETATLRLEGCGDC